MSPPTISDEERDKLAELIAIKVSERYFDLTKEYVGTQIKMHAYQCAAGKWGWFKSMASAVTGGVIVGLVLWIVKRF